MDLSTYCSFLSKKSKAACGPLRASTHVQRKKFLSALSKLLQSEAQAILKENAKDIQAAQKMGLGAAMVDRLTLDKKRISGIAKSVREIASLPDPLGRCLEQRVRKDGLQIKRYSVPIGSILFIFESRPNVTIDGAALCIKSGNSVILRGGKESVFSNQIFIKLIRKALKTSDLPQDAAQLVAQPGHDVVNTLLKQSRFIDLVIPRGGERLIHAVVEHSTIPVIKHYKGVCHVYVDKSFIRKAADLQKASDIALNAKVQRPGVCNAMETLLLDKNLTKREIRDVIAQLSGSGVEVRACPNTRKIVSGLKKATAADWDEEYLDTILSVKIVNGVEGAIAHIEKHGSGHTDAILSYDTNIQNIFIQGVDSSSVMINASTRFSDGGEYGLGAEVGISTDKLHARGPMGIESLTSYQWRIVGQGHIRK